jgi:flagellar biosynthesis protein FliQ
MRNEALSNIGGKAIAVVVLLIAGWILLKIVIGVVTAVFWTVTAVLAVIAVLWALNRLL